jgi:SAM-dependent methyltransferase
VRDYEVQRRQQWDRWAEAYDDFWSKLDASECVRFLSAACGESGSALELGAGTGRVAVPLAELGIDVTAVEISPEMATRLEEKRELKNLKSPRVIVGSMLDDLPHGESFDLVYIVFNGLFELASQDEQIECLRRCRAALAPDGVIVVESSLPHSGSLLASRQQLAIRDLSDARFDLSATQNDPVSQTVVYKELSIGDTVPQVLTVRHRYFWPEEFRLMGMVAGLRVVARHGSWLRAPLRHDSPTCVHVLKVA